MIALQRDTYVSGRILIADRKTIRSVNVTAKHVDILFGSAWDDAESLDDYGTDARFSFIVDMAQRISRHLYVMEKYCIRRIFRGSKRVETVTASCSQSGDAFGTISTAMFDTIISGVFATQSWLVVAETAQNNRIMLVDFSKNAVTKVVDSFKGVKTLFTSPFLPSPSIYAFKYDDMISISVPSGKIETIIKSQGKVIKDGLIHQVRFSFVSSAFGYNNTIIVADSKDKVLRIINLQRNLVTSVCNILPPSDVISSVLHDISKISTCQPSSPKALGIFPEIGMIMIGGKGYLASILITENYIGEKL